MVDVEISVNGSVVTPQTREAADRIGVRLAELATALVEGVDRAASIATCCTLIEDNYFDLRKRGVNFEKLAFEAVSVLALKGCSLEQLKDDAFRTALAAHLLNLVHDVDAPLDRQWQAQLVTTQIAEARLEAAAAMGVELTDDVIEQEYVGAAAFVTEQVKAGRPILKARPKRNYNYALTLTKAETK